MFNSIRIPQEAIEALKYAYRMSVLPQQLVEILNNYNLSENHQRIAMAIALESIAGDLRKEARGQ